MQQSIPTTDIKALQNLRVEAKLYLPPSEQAYADSIKGGTDPYTSKWFGLALYILGFGCAVYACAEASRWLWS